MSEKVGTFYEILGIGKDASFEEVRKAYLRAALRWHPDKNPQDKDVAESKFKRVAQAYKVLGNSLLRSQYNASGEAGLAKDWWPDDPEASRDMAYQFFIHRVPGRSVADGFSEAKLREIFPHLFGHGPASQAVNEQSHRNSRL
ncbi:unnamed protein product [Effrenium voratum]|nr:unnamed protein product [Effrenium voratum]